MATQCLWWQWDGVMGGEVVGLPFFNGMKRILIYSTRYFCDPCSSSYTRSVIHIITHTKYIFILMMSLAVRMPLTPFYRGWIPGRRVQAVAQKCCCFPCIPHVRRQVLTAQAVDNLSALLKLPKSSSWVWDFNLGFPCAPASKPPPASHT